MTDIAKPSRVALSIQRYEAAYNDADSTPDLCPLVPHLSGIIAQFFEGKNDVKEEYPNEFRITTTGLQECVRREHFMLVSDVSHLFQCWENFVKWNFRLCECPTLFFISWKDKFCSHYFDSSQGNSHKLLQGTLH